MSGKGRLSSVLLLAALFALFVLAGWYEREGDGRDDDNAFFTRRTTLDFWYDDPAMSGFFNDTAVAWNQSQDLYRVEPRLVEDGEYLTEIYNASVDGEDFPDLYCIGNYDLERCVKAGLAESINDPAHFSDYSYFPEAAISAVRYGGEITAYPLCYETSALLYNENYLRGMAYGAGRSEENAVPKTMVDVVSLAAAYEAPQAVSAVFKWDVSDVFYNYAFVGAYLNLGGPDGDDPNQIDIYNAEAIQCLQVYQQLNQFFSIDTRNDDYRQVLQDFGDGKIVFILATSDAVAELRRREEAGEIDLDYGVAPIPDMALSLLGRTMSVTDCVVINAYSAEQEAAANFIRFMLFHQMGTFYERTGKAPAQAGLVYEDPHMRGFFDAYVKSVPITKLRSAGNFWMLLESTMENVWEGGDANKCLHDLYETLMVQMTGIEDVDIGYIPDPTYISLRQDLGGF